MSFNRRDFLKTAAITSAAIASPAVIRQAFAADPIKVGVLFSLTGGLSIIEKLLADATQMAYPRSMRQAASSAEESKPSSRTAPPIRKPTTRKRRSWSSRIGCRPCSDPTPRPAARRCCRSSRSATTCYFYPTYYEGFECSKNVVYTGAVPNQQLSNYIPWIIKNARQEEVLHRRIELHLSARDGESLQDPDRAERRASGSPTNTSSSAIPNGARWSTRSRISGCDVVLSNVVGDSVVAFYREFKNQGLTPRHAADLRDGHVGNRDRGDGAGIRRRQLHLVPLFSGDRHRRQQGLRRALSQVRQRSEGGDAPRAGVVLLPGLPLEAGGGEGRRS